MRLHSITIEGFTTYTEWQTVTFDELPPGLVAIQGANGSGKTTLLEAPFAALHKTFATRPGSLYDYATGDAAIAATFVGEPGEVTVRILVDPAKRTTEGYVLIDGEPITDGKAGPFAEAVERYFGSARLMLASVFAAQDKSGSVTAMKKADRKSLFVELLGLGVLETLAERARQRAAIEEREYEKHLAIVKRINAELDAMPDLDVADAERAVHDAVNLVTAADARVLELREKVADEKHQAERVQTAKRAIQDATRAQATAEQNWKRTDEDCKRIEQRLTSLRARVADAPDPDVVRRAVEDAETKVQVARVAIDQRRQTEAAVTDFRQSKASAENVAKRTRTERIREGIAAEEQAALIQDVPCGVTNRWIDENLMVPDDHPDASEELPILDLAGECKLLRSAREAKRRIADLAQPSKFEREAFERVEQIAADLASYEADLVTMPEVAKLQSNLDAAREEYEQARAAQVQIAAQAEVREQITQTEADYERAKKRHDEAAAAVVIANDAVVQANDRLADIGAVTDSRNDLQAAEADARGAAEALTQARIGLEKAKENEQRFAQLRDEKTRTAERMSAALDTHRDAHRLAVALGKDGVQALEIDAAAPEVTELANELLAVYPGRQFSVRIDTLRTKRDGTQAEAFSIVVYEGAQERPIEALSGGERVVVGEALSLALAILNARKNAIRWQTLWRDETAGALDPEAADAYVAMLRRARELGGFHQVIFVAHQREVWEQADAVVRVENGTVSVATGAVAA